MTGATTFAQTAGGDGRPPGSVLAAGEPLTWRRGRRSCWKTDSAVRRDHLRHGPSVAAALSNDADHQACVDLFSSLHAAVRQLLVPAARVAEVGYLPAREARARGEAP